MKRSFLVALFFLGVFLMNFAAQADLGNPKAVSDLIHRCHQEHVVQPTYLAMNIRLVNWAKCYDWGKRSSLEQNQEIRSLLIEDYTKSSKQADKDELGEAIRAYPTESVRKETAEAVLSAGAID